MHAFEFLFRNKGLNFSAVRIKKLMY